MPSVEGFRARAREISKQYRDGRPPRRPAIPPESPRFEPPLDPPSDEPANNDQERS